MWCMKEARTRLGVDHNVLAPHAQRECGVGGPEHKVAPLIQGSRMELQAHPRAHLHVEHSQGACRLVHTVEQHAWQ